MGEELEVFWIVYVILICGIDVVYSRECYNFREEPKVRDCPHGCCGDDYAEFCCDATLQIVGSAVGAALVLAAIIAAVYYCYRKKRSKRRLAQRGGEQGRTTFVTRFGFRTRPANARDVHVITRQRPRIQTQHAVPNNVHLNPAYIPTIPGHREAGYNFSANQPYALPIVPTAPMPPPYSMTIAPPPYSDSKPVPPPPEYSTVVHGSSHGNKFGNYSDTMPPPST